MNPEPNKHSTVPIILALLAVGAIGYGAYVYRKRKSDSQNEHKKKTDSVDVMLLLEALEKELYKEFLGLYVYREGRNAKFKIVELDPLVEKYGKYFSAPVISWLDILKQLSNEKVEELTNTVKKYTLAHGVDLSESSLGYRQLFEEYLRQKSIKEAKEIVNDFKNSNRSTLDN